MHMDPVVRGFVLSPQTNPLRSLEDCADALHRTIEGAQCAALPADVRAYLRLIVIQAQNAVDELWERELPPAPARRPSLWRRLRRFFS